MNDDSSPWLGGPGARWAQALLFLLHVALVVALVVCMASFWKILPRLTLPAWQRASILAVLGATLAVFAVRAVRIGRDLWRAWRAREASPRGGR